MLESFYQEQAENYKGELELMTVGVIAKTGKIILDNVKAASDDRLTLKDVCDIADELNDMLEALNRKQSSIESMEKAVEDERAKSAKETGDDNH